MHNLTCHVNASSLALNDLKYKAYSLKNFRQIPQIQRLSEEQKFAIEVVGHVFSFRTNNYIVEELINWDDIPNDPIFILTFPQKEMLLPHHFEEMAAVLKTTDNPQKINETANKIRSELNPHPAGQLESNVPDLFGQKLIGIQHKYKETVLFFPSEGQTCHAYCSFCFRWPQFVGQKDLKFATKEANLLVEYLRQHPEVSDLLITGGDPLIMRAKVLSVYLKTILNAKIPHLNSIRIGTKTLGFWPYRYLTDADASELLSLFQNVIKAGVHLAIMAQFNHPAELKTAAVKEAIWRIRETGAEIRTQSPVLAHINAQSEIWAKMWHEQVRLGCIPYYMFIVRDTGAQHYFSIPLEKAFNIYRKAYQKVSGLARTVRGPSMSSHPGKIQILGISEIHDEKVFALRFLQGRDPNWVGRPFFAQYNPKAIWLNDLKPAFGKQQFFFEEEVE